MYPQLAHKLHHPAYNRSWVSQLRSVRLASYHCKLVYKCKIECKFFSPSTLQIRGPQPTCSWKMRSHRIQLFILPLDQPTGNGRSGHPKPRGLAITPNSEYSQPLHDTVGQASQYAREGKIHPHTDTHQHIPTHTYVHARTAPGSLAECVSFNFLTFMKNIPLRITIIGTIPLVFRSPG